MYKTILVPLDGSERAETIIPYVSAVAQASEATVHLLRVVELELVLDAPEVMTAPQRAPDFDDRKRQALDYLTEKQMVLEKQGIKAEIQVAQGPVIEQIVTIAELEDVDLIAIVSHGRTGLARVVYGNVAAGILQRVNCPVLVVRTMDG